MNQDILVLRSVTYAYKSQRLLEKMRIRSFIIRTPEEYVQAGCSYSLSVSSDGEKAAEILRQNGIQVLKLVKRG